MTGLPYPRVRDQGTPLPAGTTGLPDQFGRMARDLRVSVTDRCNLRCTYCMPAEGLPWLPKPEMLTDDEIIRLVRVLVGLGVRQVRLTGGEPLLRRSLVDVVRGIAALEPRPKIAMTTNGIGLDRLAQPLKDAGLDRVNVSLDTIDPEEFTALTRRDRLHDVEGGPQGSRGRRPGPGEGQRRRHARVQRHLGAGPAAVVPRPRLRAALHRADAARRPARLGRLQHGDARTRSVPASSERFTLSELPAEDRGSAPAERFLVDGGPATVGIIASVSQPFCAACDRIRLTADGQVRNCLFSRTETDLRGPMREGATDDELVRLLQGEMWRKAPGHGIGGAGFVQPDRPMSAIGG